MEGWQDRMERGVQRIGRWRVGTVVWILAGFVIWLPFRQGHGIAFPQIAALLAFFAAWALLVLFSLDLLVVQLLGIGHRRDAAVCIFEILFLLGFGGVALLNELRGW